MHIRSFRTATIIRRSRLRKRIKMRSLFRLYDRITAPIFPYAQSAFLLFVRLYWGWQLYRTGWGKLQHLDKITAYFESLNIPHAAFNARFVGGLEFVGGFLLMVGLASRLISIPLTIDLLVAYWVADREAFTSFFSDPGKFYAADPYTFLFASVLILIFGPGMFSIDALIRRALANRKRDPVNTIAA
jgi:putative oxidoreductase